MLFILFMEFLQQEYWSGLLFPPPVGRKTNQPRQHIKKQRHHFADQSPYSQSYGFLSSHVRYESWTIKKAEQQRIDAFKFWCWRRLLRVPCTARKMKTVNPGDLNIHWKDWCWNSNTLATWCEEPTHSRSQLIRDARKDWRQKDKGGSRGWDG